MVRKQQSRSSTRRALQGGALLSVAALLVGLVLSCTGTHSDVPSSSTTNNGSGASASAGAGGSGFHFGGNGGTGNPEGGNCGSVEVSFEPIIPTVVLLIDQSGSMDEDLGGDSRWEVVYDVLMDPDDGVVTQLEPFVRFGLVLYSYDDDDPGPCPHLVEVMPPALNNHATIDDVYEDESPNSDTPTGDSITAITPALAAFSEPGPKLIVLGTDGMPDRCEDPDDHGPISQGEAVAAAEAAYAQGIETVIIALAPGISDQHQQDMANAGKGLPTPAPDPCTNPAECAPTYEASNKQDMIDAFYSIINGQRGCVYTLNGTVVSGMECSGVVRVNGEDIPCNDPDGWRLNNPSEIEFLGATCDIILTDPDATIFVEFPCDAIVTPE